LLPPFTLYPPRGRHYTFVPFPLSLPSIYFSQSNKTATITIANTSTTNKTNRHHHIHIPSNADTNKQHKPMSEERESSQVKSSRIATSFTIHKRSCCPSPFSGLFWCSFHLYICFFPSFPCDYYSSPSHATLFSFLSLFPSNSWFISSLPLRSVLQKQHSKVRSRCI